MTWPEIDLARLRALNPDTVGWLRLEDTPIDYPVLREPGEDYYLTHNFSRESSRHGAVCLDNCPVGIFPGLRGRLRGHNMSDGSMFRALTGYLEREFAAAHPALSLLTVSGLYRLEVWAAVSVPYAREGLSLCPREPALYTAWQRQILACSPLEPARAPSFREAQLVLCTCQTEGSDGLSHGDVLVAATVCPMKTE